MAVTKKRSRPKKKVAPRLPSLDFEKDVLVLSINPIRILATPEYKNDKLVRVRLFYNGLRDKFPLVTADRPLPGSVQDAQFVLAIRRTKRRVFTVRTLNIRTRRAWWAFATTVEEMGVRPCPST